MEAVRAYELLFYAHVVTASIGLAVLLVPLIAKKGGALHRRVGWVFVAGMAGAAVTGLGIAASWIFAPLAVKPPAADWSPEQIAARVEHLKSFGVFLAFIGLLLLNSLSTGMGAVSRKRSPESPRKLARVMPALTALGGALLFVDGALSKSVLYAFFGVIGMLTGSTSLRFAIKPLPSRMAWWYQHMSGMLTAVIAGLTAFLVFNTHRLLGGALPRELGFLPWVLPTIAGVPSMATWIRYYRRKFGDAA